jgi:hypothetical protein
MEAAIMNSLTKIALVGALATGVTATVAVDTADAQRRVARNLVIGGLVAGAVIAGAAASSRAYAEPGYVVRRAPGCGEFRRRAIWAEERGDYGRARYWWHRFEDCRAY